MCIRDDMIFARDNGPSHSANITQDLLPANGPEFTKSNRMATKFSGFKPGEFGGMFGTSLSS
jgi:hypothetical protein